MEQRDSGSRRLGKGVIAHSGTDIGKELACPFDVVVLCVTEGELKMALPSEWYHFAVSHFLRKRRLSSAPTLGKRYLHLVAGLTEPFLSVRHATP